MLRAYVLFVLFVLYVPCPYVLYVLYVPYVPSLLQFNTVAVHFASAALFGAAISVRLSVIFSHKIRPMRLISIRIVLSRSCQRLY
ncbi:hypothetical protein J3R75_001923 [Oligosphaera ethanolica]|uniref:Uncharacterized protein n=1 Tax=Oligosphaera ethanolica TaxID=760260 RepID=A0AAE3VG73_9BACT|nr:hypothetical protein [Oligosphaera ethanolica]